MNLTVFGSLWVVIFFLGNDLGGNFEVAKTRNMLPLDRAVSFMGLSCRNLWLCWKWLAHLSVSMRILCCFASSLWAWLGADVIVFSIYLTDRFTLGRCWCAYVTIAGAARLSMLETLFMLKRYSLPMKRSLFELYPSVATIMLICTMYE